MDGIKCQINGSDYIGAYATTTDKYTIIANNVSEKMKSVVSNTLGTECIGITISGTDLIGLLCRANSNGIALPNMISDIELNSIKETDIDANIVVIDSTLNALGNNIIVNDKIAIVNNEYNANDIRQFADVFGVEILKAEIGGFKTIGANNILTNNGFAINNRGTDMEKEEFDAATGFDSIRTTANTGGLSIGLSTIANSNGLLVGNETTGFELTRIIDALNLS